MTPAGSGTPPSPGALRAGRSGIFQNLLGLGRAARWIVPVLLVAVMPSVLFAHASLIATLPADGAIFDDAPSTVRLDFDGPVRPLVARLTTPNGDTGMLTGGSVEGNSVIWALPSLAERGSYLLSWRVTAEDGHPIAGALVFSHGAATAVNAEAQHSPAGTRIGVWALRAFVLGCTLIAVGGYVFAAAFGTASDRRVAIAGLVTLPLAAGFHGLDLLGLAPSAILTKAPWAEAGAGGPGAAFMVAGLALILSLGRGWVPAALALVAAGGAAGLSGHAATAEPQALMRPAVALHVVAAALWVGALLPLAATLLRGDRRPLDRFSAAAPWAIALLLLTGTAIAVVQVGDVGLLLTTDYGLVLLVKLGLVAGMLGLAAGNRYLWAAPRHTVALRRSIAAEFVLSLLVISTIALWRFTPPPRTLAPPAAEAVAMLKKGDVSARLVVAPGRVGPVTVRVEDVRLGQEPFEPQGLTVEFAKPAYGLGPFTRAIDPARPQASGLLLPLDGFWVVRLKVLISDFRVETLEDLVEIVPARR